MHHEPPDDAGAVVVRLVVVAGGFTIGVVPGVVGLTTGTTSFWVVIVEDEKTSLS